MYNTAILRSRVIMYGTVILRSRVIMYNTAILRSRIIMYNSFEKTYYRDQGAILSYAK